LHSHLVREHPKTLEELCEEFQKFSRSKVSHFRKLDQQRKVISENEGSTPFKYTRNKEGAASFDTTHEQVHNIDSDGCGPPENWDKNLDLRDKKARTECMTQEETISKIEEATLAGAEAEPDFKKILCTACFMRKILIIGREIVLSSLNLKKR
jgi:hypothetical protein